MSALDASRWELASRLFEEAVALPLEARAAWLARATADDEIRQVVESLLAGDARESALLDATPAELAAMARPAAGHDESEDGAALIGNDLGPWRILRELGRGGMGAVYLAERSDGAFAKRVAIKVVKRGMDTDEIVGRFRRERQILAALEHPNIARLLDGGTTQDGRPYLVMEFVDGERIDRFADARRLTVEARLALMAAVCRAVAHAHQRRVVHRDLKPSNVLVTADGQVRLLDFGIAKLLDDAGDEESPRTATGRLLLTPTYASPEQRAGKPVTSAADVYALGVVLHELLVGRTAEAAAPATPDSGDTRNAVRLQPPSRAARGLDPESAEARGGSTGALARRLKGDVDTIVLKATASRPDDRYADAGAMADDLDRHLAGRSILGRPQAMRTRMREAVRAPGSPAVAVLLLLALAALAALAAVAGRQRRPSAQPATLAVRASASDPADSAGAYLVYGIGDGLATRLARLRGLRVKSPRVVRSVLGELDDPQEAGRRLGVALLLEASVQQHDSVIDVALSVVETKGGFQVWSDDYRTSKDRLMALQDSMVRDVALAVTGRLSAEERGLLASRLTSSAAAYDHFLRGNYLLRSRTPAATRDAIQQFEAAAALDHGFAEAMARCGYAYLLHLDWGWPFPGRTSDELLRTATVLTDRAVEIDPASPQVWLEQAYLRVVRDPRRHAGAIEAFERALSLDSLDAEAQHQYGQSLMLLGRDAEASAAYVRALAQEPYRPTTLVALGAMRSLAGDFTGARRWYDSALAVTRTVPAPYALAAWANFVARHEPGRAAEAAATSRRALAMDGSYATPSLSALVVAQLAAGDSAGARGTLRELMASFDTLSPTTTDGRFASPALLAMGRNDDALELLERAQPRGAQLWFYMKSPDFDAVRAHPRFQALFREVDPRRDVETGPANQARE